MGKTKSKIKRGIRYNCESLPIDSELNEGLRFYILIIDNKWHEKHLMNFLNECYTIYKAHRYVLRLFNYRLKTSYRAIHLVILNSQQGINSCLPDHATRV